MRGEKHGTPMRRGITFQINWPLGRRERFGQKAVLVLVQTSRWSTEHNTKSFRRKLNGRRVGGMRISQYQKQTDCFLPHLQTYVGGYCCLMGLIWIFRLCLWNKCDNMQKKDCFEILWNPIMTIGGKKNYMCQILLFYSFLQSIVHFTRVWLHQTLKKWHHLSLLSSYCSVARLKKKSICVMRRESCFIDIWYWTTTSKSLHKLGRVNVVTGGSSELCAVSPVLF